MSETKACTQCGKICTKDQFPKKEWKKKELPSCRVCTEFIKISSDESRPCSNCKISYSRTDFGIHQWARDTEAICPGCCSALQKQILDSIETGTMSDVKALPDGSMVCGRHSLECCDICMMDMTFPNRLERERKALGRELTDAENAAMIRENCQVINKKLCIMDGQPICPRTGRKLMCPCMQVTYCSPACQKHHWMIHKIDCPARQKKSKAVSNSNATQSSSSVVTVTNHGLTAEQLDYVRIQAFMSENSRKGSIEECAWQIGEHPLTIGGGSINMDGTLDGKFIKGDVSKIYGERNILWDGTPRFGLGPYVAMPRPVDWIAKARLGKSDAEKAREKKIADWLTL